MADGYGYMLLPTADNPTSTIAFRLTPEEKKERDEWMVGAKERGWTNAAIAYEVGLTLGSVYNILRKKELVLEKPMTLPFKRKFKSPMAAAVAEFELTEMCRACQKEVPCAKCWGRLSIIQSEYDETGWPYDWAMLGQEKYIEACA